MKLSRFAALVTLTGWAVTGWAQPSTVSNTDGTVTFRYTNPNARDVQVDVQFAGRNPMKRGADGVWTATLGPAAPDMYPYCFVVDGVSVMDPLCPQYFPNEGFKNSLLEIPAREGSLAHDIKDVPHGRIEYIHYYSQSLKGTNNAIVYLPPSYYREGNQQRYPVFYLISGTTDTEEVYYKVGRMNYILDNLVAEGKAREMIIVLPYGNPTKLLPTPPQGMMGFGMDVFGNDLIGDLMPYVESHYRTINDADHRAIGDSRAEEIRDWPADSPTSTSSPTSAPTRRSPPPPCPTSMTTPTPPTAGFTSSGWAWAPTTSSTARRATIWSFSTSMVSVP